MAKRSSLYIAAHLIMLAVMATAVTLALTARHFSPRPAPELATDWALSTDEDDAEWETDLEEDGDNAWRPSNIPPDGSPLLAEQERIEGLRRFVGETLTYDFGWHGFAGLIRVRAARARMRVELEERNGRERYVIRGNGRTRGMAASLWAVNGQAETVIDGPTGLVVRYILDYRENEKHEKQTVRFDETGREATRHRIRYDRDDRERTEVNPTPTRIDPASLAYYLRYKARDDAPTEAKFFTGKDAYSLRLRPAGREDIRVEAGSFRALKMRVTLTELADPDSNEDDEKVEDGTLWVSDDHLRIPLKLEASTFVGKIVVELTERTTW